MAIPFAQGAPPSVLAQGFVPGPSNGNVPPNQQQQQQQPFHGVHLHATGATATQQQQQGSMLPMTFIQLPAAPTQFYPPHQPQPQHVQLGGHPDQHQQQHTGSGGHEQAARTVSGLPQPSEGVATVAAPTPFATAALAHDPADKGPKQLIVNFLAPTIAVEDLTELFAPVGPLAAVRIMRDLKTNESKGFGFVYFHSSADAAAAIRRVTGRTMEGRRIKVSYANPQRPLD
jgi:hypothetical protein